MILVNPQTLQTQEVPNPLTLNGQSWFNPTQEMAFQAGWLIPQYPSDPVVGYDRKWQIPAWKDNGDGTASPLYSDVSVADEHAAEAAEAAQLAAQIAEAKQAQFTAIIQALTPLAQLYRSTLRTLFGANAETNQAISQAYVMGYFTQQILTNGKLTDLQLTQETVLSQGFTALSQITGDGTTWTFPWNLIP